MAREDVDIVLDDEAARTMAETLQVPRTTPEQGRRAALLLCDVAGRRSDVADAEQLRAAARLARPALEALGLIGAPENGSPDDAPPDPGHGTVAAYSAHRRRGEAPCDECRAAMRSYNRHRHAQHAGSPRPVAPCGTEAAYKRHLDHETAVCDDCRTAHAAYERDRHRKRAAKAGA